MSSSRPRVSRKGDDSVRAGTEEDPGGGGVPVCILVTKRAKNMAKVCKVENAFGSKA